MTLIEIIKIDKTQRVEIPIDTLSLTNYDQLEVIEYISVEIVNSQTQNCRPKSILTTCFVSVDSCCDR